MAKHPHRLLLIDGKTWKCALPGCSFFVHLGLAYVLIGKRAVCWECSEQFTITAETLQHDTASCDDCKSGGISKNVEDYTEARLALAKHGVKRASEMDPKKLRALQDMGFLPKNIPAALTDPPEEDQIEVIEPTRTQSENQSDEVEHEPDCASLRGFVCSCGVE
jgi:hypothetical protein